MELGNISEGAAVNLPSVTTLARNIRAARQERNVPPNPQTRMEIPELPEEYQVTSGGEQFLAFDSGVGDDQRMFIFASPQGLQALGNSEHWFADGTFKVCPEVFYQVYTVHAENGGRIFPCIFALLPNKTEVTYRRLFHQVFRLTNTFGNGPVDILVDFERSAINALRYIRPHMHVKGCFYHLSCNIWK